MIVKNANDRCSQRSRVKNTIVAEYALRNTSKPMDVA